MKEKQSLKAVDCFQFTFFDQSHKIPLKYIEVCGYNVKNVKWFIKCGDYH